jgi:alpha-galactosidase
MSIDPKSSQPKVAVAQHVKDIRLDAGHPAPEWGKASPIVFCADWQGVNPEPDRETRLRLLWSSKNLYLRFECRYREINVFPDSDANGRRDHLWDRDVAEAFLQPDVSRPLFYKEFEISPNGMWIDLDISPDGLVDLKSGLQRSAVLDPEHHTWAAELAIPIHAITMQFDPHHPWHANFYRVEGQREPRSYLAWNPTHTAQPNFHVPEAFGLLRFEK